MAFDSLSVASDIKMSNFTGLFSCTFKVSPFNVSLSSVVFDMAIGGTGYFYSFYSTFKSIDYD